MTVLVVGGSGFIGSNLIARLLELGHGEIRVFDLKRPPAADDFTKSGVSYIMGDIRNRAALEQALEGVDDVVHLAADTRVIDSIADPEFNFDTNVIGSFNLLEAMRKKKVRKLVNASTGGAIIGKCAGAVNEAMAPAPLAPYGSSKLAVEGYCSAYSASYDMQITSLRFSNVFGPRSYHKGSVVAAFYKNIAAGKPITIFGDGTQTRDYIYVDDICSGILLALKNKVSGAVQLGSGYPTSIHELVQHIEEVVGRRLTPAYQDARVGEIHHTYCDISKARSLLGFEPSRDLVGNLRRTWQWFQAAGAFAEA